MLIALAAEINDALASKKRKVTLHSCLDGALTKSAKFLPMLLAVENGGFKCGRIEVLCDWRQAFEDKGCGHDCSRGAVE